MAGLFGTLQMARGAIQTQQRGVQNASANIANVNTPGYTRRTIALQALTPELPVGGGVGVKSETRTVDNFLRAQSQRAGVDVAFANARESSLSALEALRAPDGTSSLDSTLQSFFNAMSALASNPSSTAQRTQTLQAAKDLASAFNNESDALTRYRSGIDDQLGDQTTQANQLAANIADLNKRISDSESQGHEASVLRDQRDEAASSLASLTGGQILSNSRGETTVLAFGTALVDGPKALTLSNNPPDITANGQVVTSRVLGGSMGALIQSRDTDALAQQQGLDTLAANIANAYNAIHSSGVGLDGVGGRALFSGTTAATLGVALTDGKQLAASDSAATLPGNNVNALALADLQNTQTFADDHRALITNLTTATESARTDQSSRLEEQATATAMEDSVSGVSVDDELTRLMQFQRGYEASAKVIKTVNDLFDTLLTLGGR